MPIFSVTEHLSRDHHTVSVSMRISYNKSNLVELSRASLLLCSGTFAGNVRRLLADDLGAAVTVDCDDDEAGRAWQGRSYLYVTHS